MTRTKKPQLVQIFEKHSSSVYHAMQQRVVKLRGTELPFTLKEFRAWLLEKFGSAESVIQCTYCNAWLHVGSYVTDHREPLFFGGSAGLENLDLVCQSCNTAKGRMSSDGFRQLVTFSIHHLHSQDANDMFSRMKNGSAYVRMRATMYSKGRHYARR